MHYLSLHSCTNLYILNYFVKTGGEFDKEEDHHLGEVPFNFTRFKFSRYCHDATWALAWSLQRALERKLADVYKLTIQQNAHILCIC